MKAVTIREATRFDWGVWQRMRHLLWPEEMFEGHEASIETLLHANDSWCFADCGVKRLLSADWRPLLAACMSANTHNG
jgi:hypothetical protein